MVKVDEHEVVAREIDITEVRLRQDREHVLAYM